MKLIIDIDKKIYDRAMLGDFNITVFDEAVRNGIPLEEELEKIKAEIHILKLVENREKYFAKAELTRGYELGLEDYANILDKYIAELKGE